MSAEDSLAVLPTALAVVSVCSVLMPKENCLLPQRLGCCCFVCLNMWIKLVHDHLVFMIEEVGQQDNRQPNQGQNTKLRIGKQQCHNELILWVSFVLIEC